MDETLMPSRLTCSQIVARSEIMVAPHLLPRTAGFGRLVAAGLAMATALLSPPAFAQADTDPPVITHTPISQAKKGVVKVDFRIVDKSPLFGVLFHWRQVGETAYKPKDYPTSQEKYSAEIEVSRDFEFWIEAYDEQGNGPAMDGTADAPNRVTVVESGGSTKTDQGDDEDDKGPAGPYSKKDAPMEVGKMRLTRIGRVAGGRNIPPGMMEITGGGGIVSGSDFLYAGGSLSGGGGGLRFQYAPLAFVALNLGVRYSSTSLALATGASRSGSAMGDMTLGARLASGPLSIVRVALDIYGDIASGVSSLPAATAGAREGLVISPGVQAAVSIDAHEAARIHMNFGYRWDNTENLYADRAWTDFQTFAWSLSRYDTMAVALAAEFPLFSVANIPLTPFLEYSAGIPVNRRALGGCAISGGCTSSPSLFPAFSGQIAQVIGIGARYEIIPLLAADLAVELSATAAGSGFSDPAFSGIRPLAGYAPPPPLAVRLNLSYQFGAENTPDTESLSDADLGLLDPFGTGESSDSSAD